MPVTISTVLCRGLQMLQMGVQIIHQLDWVREEHRLWPRGDSAPTPHHQLCYKVFCHSSLSSPHLGGQALWGFKFRLSVNKNIKTKLGTRQLCSCGPIKKLNWSLYIFKKFYWSFSIPYFLFCSIFGFQVLNIKGKRNHCSERCALILSARCFFL